jgi:hypothetical protein
MKYSWVMDRHTSTALLVIIALDFDQSFICTRPPTFPFLPPMFPQLPLLPSLNYLTSSTFLQCFHQWITLAVHLNPVQNPSVSGVLNQPLLPNLFQLLFYLKSQYLVCRLHHHLPIPALGQWLSWTLWAVSSQYMMANWIPAATIQDLLKW